MAKMMSKTREEKLNEYQREHTVLVHQIKEVQSQINPLENKKRKLSKRRYEVGQAIYDLKHDGDTPEITDHAIVRYLQRVEKVDINELKLKVAKSKNAHRVGNVIVTVMGRSHE